MRFFKKKKITPIDFDEILVDSSNLPDFNRGRLEGRLEMPISYKGLFAVGGFFSLIALIFLGQLFKLQIIEGKEYADRSANNRLDTSYIFAERGVIYDRKGERLAWNAEGEASRDFAERVYTDRRGLGQVLGYVNYPRKDSSGFYFRTDYVGQGGVESAYEDVLKGKNGERLFEVDALGNLVSEHIVHMPESGEPITLTIDAELTEALYDHIATSAAKANFRSGAAAIMDVETGEILTMVSYPSFDPEVMTRGSSEEIDSYNDDERLPFLNKVISGLYTPGSIVKPFMALAALEENIIDPNKVIVSTGALTVPNPYTPSRPSVFSDWKAHGAVTMRTAIQVSSNVYFYVIGGGFGDQKGLGIEKISKYMHAFGFDEPTGITLGGEEHGLIPTPAWKKERLDEEWRLGDTYHTSIGQFSFQTTPLAALRAYAAIANGGTLHTPYIVAGEKNTPIALPIAPSSLRVIHEGMKLAAEDGTARALKRGDMSFGGKTGTAELDAQKKYVNSWVVGFYPYEKPKYAFLLLMERGPYANLFGASPIMSQFFTWMRDNTPEYFTDLYTEEE
ncbi:hypothetical protein K2X96_01670 [Patescibacteria group bacterium]|nr:hypothetical protein [Patescibacteria group bacterium]